MRALKTFYRDTWFRSRTAAKWAVLFSSLGIAWEHEPQGFTTATGGIVPTFKLTYPNGSVQWATVLRDLASVHPADRQRLIDLDRTVPNGLVLLDGSPSGALFAEGRHLDQRDFHVMRVPAAERTLGKRLWPSPGYEAYRTLEGELPEHYWMTLREKLQLATAVIAATNFDFA